MAKEKTKIQLQREATYRGAIDQNGNNPIFYRAYDEDGRVAGTKEGITTLPRELAPREKNVKRDVSVYSPKVVDAQVIPKAFIEVEGESVPLSKTQAHGMEWRTTPTVGEAEEMLKK